MSTATPTATETVQPDRAPSDILEAAEVKDDTGREKSIKDSLGSSGSLMKWKEEIQNVGRRAIQFGSLFFLFPFFGLNLCTPSIRRLSSLTYGFDI